MNRDLDIEAKLDIMRMALEDIGRTESECDYAFEPERDRPRPCPCPHCVVRRTMAATVDWRFRGARPDRVDNGQNPRETLIVAAWKRFLTGASDLAGVSEDARLSQILSEERERFDPVSQRDWFVATSVVQWLATNVGSSVLGAAGFEYQGYDSDDRRRQALSEKREIVRVVSGLALKDTGEMLMALRRKDSKRGSMWEHAGGKIEPGETPEQALVREWREELGVEIEVGRWVSSAVIDVEVVLDLTLYQVTIKPGAMPQPLLADDLVWVTPAHAIERLPCTPATYAYYKDIVRLLERR